MHYTHNGYGFTKPFFTTYHFVMDVFPKQLTIQREPVSPIPMGGYYGTESGRDGEGRDHGNAKLWREGVEEGKREEMSGACVNP